MAEKIRNLEISNYRGIKHADLENFGDINVFIGKNGTGKSTVLEAIAIGASKCKVDYLGNSIFVNILNRRGWDKNKFYDIVEELNYQHKHSPKICINRKNAYFLSFFSSISSQDFETIKKEIKKEIEEIKVAINVNRLLKKEEKWYCTHYLWIDREKNLQYFILWNKELKNIFEDVEPVIALDNYMLRNLSLTANIFEKLIDLFGWKAKQAIIDGIKFLYSDVKDIDIKENIIRAIFDEYSLTFPSLADGLKSTLIVSIITYLLDKGFICIEEPENHLHPGMMEFYVDKIVESSKKRKNQIFISTHSLDFISLLLKRVEKENISVNLYHLIELEKGILKYVCYSKEDALGAIEKIGIDLRKL